ncbi:YfbM family protein [Streptomyces sp. NPDC048248]|uniref:YfbM family protein n=1 Tax=Streptomyces sp. NPDC048248 TaxID=3365523 RepID=UPI003716B2D4
MSMIGQYARVTAAELQRAVSDPEWALEMVGERMDEEADTEPEPAKARCLDIGTAWDALGYLLRRRAFPVDIVHGEEPMADAEDWGYGPPRYLTPERVRTAAEEMARTSAQSLTAGVAPDELAASQVYPAVVWERGEPLDHVGEHYAELQPFFRAAAAEGDGMLIWLG